MRLLQASSGGEKANFEVDLMDPCFRCAAPWHLAKALADHLKIPLNSYLTASS